MWINSNKIIFNTQFHNWAFQILNSHVRLVAGGLLAAPRRCMVLSKVFQGLLWIKKSPLQPHVPGTTQADITVLLMWIVQGKQLFGSKTNMSLKSQLSRWPQGVARSHLPLFALKKMKHCSVLLALPEKAVVTCCGIAHPVLCFLSILNLSPRTQQRASQWQGTRAYGVVLP